MCPAAGKQVLRIIAGQWRGRKIHFPANPAIRPTPDRVRETLFNWLMPVIEGANCLDLFAGSGVLGLEALSRGASTVVFVDSHRKIIDALSETGQLLNADGMSCRHEDALRYLANCDQQFDIVFLDPPYGSELLLQAAESLVSHSLLKNNAYIYVEHEQDFDPASLPSSWQLYRNKQAGQVCFSLYTSTN